MAAAPNCVKRALDREVFDQFRHRQQWLRRAANIKLGHAQLLIAMAARKRSASTLKEIEVIKIIAPGNADTKGWV